MCDKTTFYVGICWCACILYFKLHTITKRLLHNSHLLSRESLYAITNILAYCMLDIALRLHQMCTCSRMNECRHLFASVAKAGEKAVYCLRLKQGPWSSYLSQFRASVSLMNFKRLSKWSIEKYNEAKRHIFCSDPSLVTSVLTVALKEWFCFVLWSGVLWSLSIIWTWCVTLGEAD